MATVVRLDEYRKRDEAEEPLLYCCQRCDGREFTLHASGVTYCVDCGALMRNLVVVSVVC
jgi:hypothetical protein